MVNATKTENVQMGSVLSEFDWVNQSDLVTGVVAGIYNEVMKRSKSTGMFAGKAAVISILSRFIRKKIISSDSATFNSAVGEELVVAGLNGFYAYYKSRNIPQSILDGVFVDVAGQFGLNWISGNKFDKDSTYVPWN